MIGLGPIESIILAVIGAIVGIVLGLRAQSQPHLKMVLFGIAGFFLAPGAFLLCVAASFKLGLISFK